MHLIDKRVGETPLQALERFRAARDLPGFVPLSYAGRLDPMASGQLLVLVGEECAHRERYLGLGKTYRVETLLGAYSDTGDVLGIVTAVPAPATSLMAARAAAPMLLGAYEAPYPPFSSRTVLGKPLFQWALEGRTREIEIPPQRGFVRSLEALSLSDLPAGAVRRMVDEKLALAPATGFRLDEARASWEGFFGDAPAFLQVLTFEATVAAGTYMRTLADDLAGLLGSRGLALSIHRERILLPKALTDSSGEL